MPEEAIMTTAKPKAKRTVKKDVSPEKKNDRLDALLDKLEERLAIFDENELKHVCAKHLVSMKEILDQLEEVHTKIYEVLGLTYQDIAYPKE